MRLSFSTAVVMVGGFGGLRAGGVQGGLSSLFSQLQLQRIAERRADMSSIYVWYQGRSWPRATWRGHVMARLGIDLPRMAMVGAIREMRGEAYVGRASA